MRALGYRLQLVDGAAHFAWRGHRRPPPPTESTGEARTPGDSPFAILAGVSFGAGGARADTNHRKGR
jgi:hypothetical protein